MQRSLRLSLALTTTVAQLGNFERRPPASLNKAYETRSLVGYDSSRETTTAPPPNPVCRDKYGDQRTESVRSSSPEPNRDLEPSVLSVLADGNILGYAISATTLCQMNDEDFVVAIHEAGIGRHPQRATSTLVPV